MASIEKPKLRGKCLRSEKCSTGNHSWICCLVYHNSAGFAVCVRQRWKLVQYRGELSANQAKLASVIRANTGKTVRAAYARDNVETLFIHTLDDEGFVCDLATERTEPPA